MSATRWDEIAGALRARIVEGGLKPGDKIPSEADLAVEWGVCRMTAHRAVAELGRQGLVVRRRRAGTVVAAPRPARPDSAARMVALLFFHTNDFPQVEYIAGFRGGLSERDHVLFCDTNNKTENEAVYLKRFLTEADAVCCYPSGDPANTPLLRRLIDAGKPVICLDRIPDGLDADAVLTDNYGSTREALRRLRERGGHRHIAFFTSDRRSVSAIRERYDAYAVEMAAAGVMDFGRLVRAYRPGFGYDFDAFAAAIRADLEAMLAGPEPPTAIFCLEDYFLAAVVEACADLGLAVPRDLEVIGFNDCPPVLPRPERSLHRITQRAWEMGRMAAERLERRLDGAETGPPVVQRVPARIQFVGEAAPPNARPLEERYF